MVEGDRSGLTVALPDVDANVGRRVAWTLVVRGAVSRGVSAVQFSRLGTWFVRGAETGRGGRRRERREELRARGPDELCRVGVRPDGFLEGCVCALVDKL